MVPSTKGSEGRTALCIVFALRHTKTHTCFIWRLPGVLYVKLTSLWVHISVPLSSLTHTHVMYLHLLRRHHNKNGATSTPLFSADEGFIEGMLIMGNCGCKYNLGATCFYNRYINSESFIRTSWHAALFIYPFSTAYPVIFFPQSNLHRSFWMFLMLPTLLSNTVLL